MAATRNEISNWFDYGIEKGAAYMVVICDTYDYKDYPSFFYTANEVQRKKAAPGDMQKIMEIYDLRDDKSSQMNARRAMAL